TVGTVTTAYSDTVSAGDVISQSPVGLTPAVSGTAVDMVVSLGELPTATISGYIVEPDYNTPVEDVLVSAANDVNSITDSNGYYELTVDYGWSGTVTPAKEGYTFDPNSDIYSNISSDYNNMDFVAELSTFIIFGYVTESDDVTPIADVNVSAENGGGSYTSRYGGGSDMTDANGYYIIVVDYNFTGKVTPAKYAYVFEPNSIEYTDVNDDQPTSQDYIGTELTYTVAGYILNDCNNPIEGVSVNANNGGGSGISDANGFYEVWVDYNWSGTITPSKTNTTFTPVSTAYADVLDDIEDQNYLANNIYDLDCDGFIGYGDVEIISNNWLEIVGLQPNCVGHWKMNDSNNDTVVIDSSGNGNHGIAQQNTEDINDIGRINGALTFNGTSDYVDIGDVIGTGTYTKVAWIKRTVDARYYHNIVSSQAASNALWHDIGGYLKAGHASSSSYTHVQDSSALAADVWYHVAVTFDSGNMVLYKDGVPVDQASGIPMQAPSTTIYIGRILNANTYNFNGSIDNVMVFNKALTAGEISALYNNGDGTENVPSDEIDGDFTNDGIVNFLDFAEFGLAW
ncbi:LamG-like jellyroll fold domain-containing protein, partial [Planctomycetota bacterium]